MKNFFSVVWQYFGQKKQQPSGEEAVSITATEAQQDPEAEITAQETQALAHSEIPAIPENDILIMGAHTQLDPIVED
jgi:hypothetical protein